MIVCRNVMIYFDRDLQDRVHELFLDSLVPYGLLALGHKESVKHTSYAARYSTVDELERIYRKVA